MRSSEVVFTLSRKRSSNNHLNDK